MHLLGWTSTNAPTMSLCDGKSPLPCNSYSNVRIPLDMTNSGIPQLPHSQCGWLASQNLLVTVIFSVKVCNVSPVDSWLIWLSPQMVTGMGTMWMQSHWMLTTSYHVVDSDAGYMKSSYYHGPYIGHQFCCHVVLFWFLTFIHGNLTHALGPWN